MAMHFDTVERRVFAIVFAAGEIRGRKDRDFDVPGGCVLPGVVVRRLIRKGVLSVHQLGTKERPAIVRPSIGARGRVIPPKVDSAAPSAAA